MLVGISGHMGSGKDTFAYQIMHVIARRNGHETATWPEKEDYVALRWKAWPWEIRKYATKLKQVASILTGVPVEMFDDQKFKETYLPKQWSGNREDNGFTYDIDMSIRSFLQKLGTDAIRNNLHPNVWVNALMADYKHKSVPRKGVVPYGDAYMVEQTKEIVHSDKHPLYFEPRYPNWLVTDVRFPNEAEAIKGRDGIVVRINRMKSADRKAGVGGTHLHPSEIALDSYEFDWVVNNSGSMEDLYNKAEEFVERFKL